MFIYLGVATLCLIKPSVQSMICFILKPQDLLPIPKFVRRTKGSKHKIVNGQIFEKAANLGPYLKEI